MSNEAKVAAYVSGAVLDALWQRFGQGPDNEDAADAEYEQWKAVAVAAVEALPVSESGEEWRQEKGSYDEALEMVRRRFAAGLLRTSDVSVFVAAVERLTAERDSARDLAFRAAFADEEGGNEEWNAGCSGHCGFLANPYGGIRREWAEQLARSFGEDHGEHRLLILRRTVSPWKPGSP